MGSKTSIAAVVPAATHVAAAQALGRSPAGMSVQAQTQINDCINLLKQIVKDMTSGNATDPNIVTFNAVIAALS